MQISEEKFEELKEAFEYNDLNKDGRIEFGEFASMLNDLDESLEQREIKVGFAAIDTDKDGSIDLSEFVDWWSER